MADGRPVQLTRRTVLGTGAAAAAALTLAPAPSAYAAKAPSSRDVSSRWPTLARSVSPAGWP